MHPCSSVSVETNGDLCSHVEGRTVALATLGHGVGGSSRFYSLPVLW